MKPLKIILYVSILIFYNDITCSAGRVSMLEELDEYLDPSNERNNRSDLPHHPKRTSPTAKTTFLLDENIDFETKHNKLASPKRTRVKLFSDALQIFDLQPNYSEKELEERFEEIMEDINITYDRLSKVAGRRNYNVYEMVDDLEFFNLKPFFSKENLDEGYLDRQLITHESYHILINRLQEKHKIINSLSLLQIKNPARFLYPEFIPTAVRTIQEQFERLTEEYQLRKLNKDTYEDIQDAYEYLCTIYPIKDYLIISAYKELNLDEKTATEQDVQDLRKYIKKEEAVSDKKTQDDLLKKLDLIQENIIRQKKSPTKAQAQQGKAKAAQSSAQAKAQDYTNPYQELHLDENSTTEEQIEELRRYIKAEEAVSDKETQADLLKKLDLIQENITAQKQAKMKAQAQQGKAKAAQASFQPRAQRYDNDSDDE